MGVDTILWLPARAQVRNVAKAAAILVGAKVERRSLGDRGHWVADVQGGTTHITQTPVHEMVRISIHVENSKTTLWPNGIEFPYFFEFGPGGSRGIIMRSFAQNIALLVGLAKFFGGRVVYKDSGSGTFKQPDVRYDKTPPWIDAEDGAMWDELQTAFLNLQPLTAKDVAKYNAIANYRD